MHTLRKSISVGFAAIILASSTPALAQWGWGGGCGGWSDGYGGYGGYGGGMAGAAIVGMALGAIARSARRQNQYNKVYAYPWPKHYAPPARSNFARKGRNSYRTNCIVRSPASRVSDNMSIAF